MTISGELRLHGYPVSEGVALGRVALLHGAGQLTVPYFRVAPAALAAEKDRFFAATERASEQLDLLIAAVSQRIGVAQSNIFVAQQMMVRDPHLHDEITAVIGAERINAEAALVKVLDKYEALLQDVDNEYLKDRSSDIGELRRRLLEILRGSPAAEPPLKKGSRTENGPRVIVAHELTPTQTVTLDPENTAGFITERGGPASHAAILARALGIPAVSGVANVVDVLRDGEQVLLDGNSGLVTLRPTAATLRVYPSVKRMLQAHHHAVPPLDGLEVMANINLSTDLQEVLAAEAEGIGLYRTEYECFAANRLLDEEEQYERYAAVVEGMAGLPVHFRLFDFGGDKPAPFIDLPKEENPCLGFRGARLLLGRPDLLIAQARALVRASQHGPVNVIYPMIADLEQFLVLRERFRQHTGDLEGGIVKHGIMFEVPSACLSAGDFFRVADFGSIGSNDLIQYLFAVDRNNSLVGKDYNPDHPAFWNLLTQVNDAARAHGKPLSLCGEIGGQPQYIPKLLETGIRTLSMSPRIIGVARLSARPLMVPA